MTKKQDAFEGNDLSADTEPLKFEETSSLFEEGAEITTSKDSPTQEKIPPQERPSSPKNEISAHHIAEDIHTIGAFLKQIREEKEINLKIISQHTKISMTNLLHLEEDHLQKLPNRAYVIGYVKSYAKVLQLNQNDCLELLDSTYGIEKSISVKKDIHQTIPEHPSNEKTEEPNANGIKAGFVIGAVAIAAFVLILRNTGKEEKVVETHLEPAKVQEVEKETPHIIVPQTIGATTPLKKMLSDKPIEIASELKPENQEMPVLLKEKKIIEITKKEEKKQPKPIEPIKKETKKEKKEEQISFRPLVAQLYSHDSKMTQEEIDQFLPRK